MNEPLRMNAVQVGRLLGEIALRDNRKLPERDEDKTAAIATWLDLLGDLTYADCLTAVKDHFRESDEYLKARHIRERVAAMQRDRVLAAPSLEPPLELLGNEAKYREWLRDAQQAIANGAPPAAAIEAANRQHLAIEGGAQ
jgi:hypothetical protein